MPRKGTRFQTRRPQKDYTRSDGLIPDPVKKLLILDLESADPSLAPSEIAGLRNCYGAPGSNLRQAVCKRVTKLRTLKTKNETGYW